MKDRYGRVIDYLRISVTDRCDLRCVYCMPEEGVPAVKHSEVLRYEEILRLARIFAELGVQKIRLTGGEPLVRQGIPALVQGLKSVRGIEKVVMTTNGMLLSQQLPALMAAGLDGVNISLDTLDEAIFAQITRRSGVEKVLRAIDEAAANLSVKLNCVPTVVNQGGLAALAAFAEKRGVPLRFIELMPIGMGKQMTGLSQAQVTELLEKAFNGPLQPMDGAADKCQYFTLPTGGVVGFISPLSHRFCSSCNRIRLSATGAFKTCLQYEAGVNLRPLLGGSDEGIRAAIFDAIQSKPAGHHFCDGQLPEDELGKMSQIGG
ncbi:MAG: GTP 3',8-cyclase MoaA [Eubacteriales bacterium]|nr:GTP 3',8-cyclase MoaA [Eubacteriales bacterium]